MRILLATDGSACSDAVVSEVARRPWPEGTEVRVVTADLPGDPGFFRGAPRTVFDDFLRQQRSVAMKTLADAVARLEPASGLTVSSQLVEGDPKNAILDEVDRWKPDLVMVGSHGHGVMKRAWLGSVSLAVATYAPCSVEIVRCPAASEQPQSAAPSH